MMNLIDYLVGNTDRHWGNWGFLVNDDTNRLEKLYPRPVYDLVFMDIDLPRMKPSAPKAIPQIKAQANDAVLP